MTTFYSFTHTHTHTHAQPRQRHLYTTLYICALILLYMCPHNTIGNAQNHQRHLQDVTSFTFPTGPQRPAAKGGKLFISLHFSIFLTGP